MWTKRKNELVAKLMAVKRTGISERQIKEMEVEAKKQGMKKGWKRRWRSYSDIKDGRSRQAKSEIACYLK